MREGITRISKSAVQMVFNRVIKAYNLPDDSPFNESTKEFRHKFLAVDRGWKNDYSLVVVNESGEFTYFVGGKNLSSKDFYFYLRGIADAKELQKIKFV